MTEPAGPRFSIVTPAYQTPPELLQAAVDSVLAQTFGDWELVVVDDGSPGGEVMDVAGAAAATDPRIVVRRLDVNGGIVAASGEGLRAARGEFIALLDHDDLLHPEALEECDRYLAAVPACDVLYTDEEGIDLEGRPLGPFLKPDWSPERLRGQQYVNHLCLYRRSLVEEVGGFRDGFDGSQDYDLLLRCTERARHVGHVPRVLYQWRSRPGQVSSTGNPAVYAAARRALEEHCERTGRPADVEQIDPLGIYRPRYRLKGQPLVSLVVPTRGSSGTVRDEERVMVREAVRGICEGSTYPNFEIVVVADRVMGADEAARLTDLAGGRLRVVWYDRRFNFSHKINTGAGAARGDYLVLLNDDVELVSPDWLETMLGLAQQDDVGMVGATLHFEDGTIQHAGHLYLGEAAIGHVGYGAPASWRGPAHALVMNRECSGVTAACAMIRTRVFFEVGGMSRLFPMNYNDVDLSLKVRSTGRRIVCTPFAVLDHFESKTRKVGVSRSEMEAVEHRWGHELRRGDPYWRHPDPDWLVTEAPEVAVL